jgi:predicted GIY-YIG superfamily endonuclease
MQRDEFCETKLLQDKIAAVYWLHLKDDTDVFTQGYVGVTTRLIEVRFKEHCSKFMNSYNPYNPLHLAFAKHGIENIVITRLCVCNEKEAYNIEKIFRPFEYMGWNSAQGGKFSPKVIEIIHRKRNAILSR